MRALKLNVDEIINIFYYFACYVGIAETAQGATQNDDSYDSHFVILGFVQTSRYVLIKISALEYYKFY